MRLLIVNDFGVACPVINRECHEIEYWEDVCTFMHGLLNRWTDILFLPRTA